MTCCAGFIFLPHRDMSSGWFKACCHPLLCGRSGLDLLALWQGNFKVGFHDVPSLPCRASIFNSFLKMVVVMKAFRPPHAMKLSLRVCKSILLAKYFCSNIAICVSQFFSFTSQDITTMRLIWPMADESGDVTASKTVVSVCQLPAQREVWLCVPGTGKIVICLSNQWTC